MQEKLEQNYKIGFIRNIRILSILKLKLYYKKISTLLLFSVFFLIFLAVDIVGLFLIKSQKSVSLLTSINWLILTLSILLFLLTVYVTIKIFKEEISNNLHNLELRYGYKPKELYISRILSSLSIILGLYLILLLTNISFGLPENQLFSIFAYRLYISSLAWYIMTILIAYTLTIFFSTFVSSIVSIVSIILLFFIIIFGVATGGNYVANGYTPKNSNSNVQGPSETLKKLKNYEFKKSLNNIDNSLTMTNFFSFVQSIKANKGEKTNGYEIDSYNLFFLGPKSWANLSELKQNPDFKQITDLYDYFDLYFNNYKFDYQYFDIIGFNNDNDQEKNEPLGILLSKMKKTINIKYDDLINNLLKFNHDTKALQSLGIIYKWFVSSSNAINILVDNIVSITTDNKISPTEILFYKLLGHNILSLFNNLENLNKNYYKDYYNSKKNPLDVITEKSDDETKYYLKIQRRNLIINPLVQFNTLFNSVNYFNFYLDNSLSSYGKINSFKGTINYRFNDEKNETNSELYQGHFVISCLIIFGSYFKFKRNLTKK